MFNDQELSAIRQACHYAMSHCGSAEDYVELKAICEKIDGLRRKK